MSSVHIEFLKCILLWSVTLGSYSSISSSHWWICWAAFITPVWCECFVDRVMDTQSLRWLLLSGRAYPLTAEELTYQYRCSGKIHLVYCQNDWKQVMEMKGTVVLDSRRQGNFDAIGFLFQISQHRCWLSIKSNPQSSALLVAFCQLSHRCVHVLEQEIQFQTKTLCYFQPWLGNSVNLLYTVCKSMPSYLFNLMYIFISLKHSGLSFMRK